MAEELEKKPAELSDTVEGMLSTDYKERFIAEYEQLSIRAKKLETMLEKWENGTLDFKPTCPRSTYTRQMWAMDDYIAILEARAVMEGVELPHATESEGARE